VSARKRGVVVDLGTTLEERFPKEEMCRSMTPEECLEFVKNMHDWKIRQAFLSLEKAVREYRAAVRQDER